MFSKNELFFNSIINTQHSFRIMANLDCSRFLEVFDMLGGENNSYAFCAYQVCENNIGVFVMKFDTVEI